MARWPTPSCLYDSYTTQECVSGGRAVSISQSGYAQVAMASMSGRMPAAGVAMDPIDSGQQINVFSIGTFTFSSGMVDYSGCVGSPLYVGRSGHIVWFWGSWNSGGFVSGDILQQIGNACDSGSIRINVTQAIMSGGPPNVTTSMMAPGSVSSGIVASGSIGQYALSSGCIVSGGIGNNVIVSGSYASGSVSQFILSSGTVNSGQINTTGTPSNTVFMRGDFAWSSPGVSGITQSGAITGSLGGGFFNIASGTIGPNDIGSGAIVSGRIASGQIGNFHLASGSVTSGAIASGQLSTYHLASGATATRSQFVGPFVSGTFWNANTQETISGTRAVSLSQSGNLQIAMAAVSGRMPAIGIVVDNVLSGISVNVYTQGVFQFSSGMSNYSGYLGKRLFVGRSGQITVVSGAWSSGGFASGDIGQVIGTPINSGGAFINLVFGSVWSGGPLGISAGVL
jgi:hypothetical protein